MQAERTNNVNVIAQDVLMTPAEIKRALADYAPGRRIRAPESQYLAADY